nr:hypothetical protein [Tanacetum cinerariifolium]
TTATTLEQQVALDEALVPSAQRLMIRRSNFRLPSDIQSEEPTLQVVYDVLRNSPFFKAFLVTADVPKIYMQEFWATVKLHQHSIRFKMDTRKHVLDLEAFREMLHISPRILGQSFAELPFEEEILEFLMFLGHSTQIKTLTDPSIPRRNRVNWHYVRDDVLFSTIKVVSRHQNTQQYGAILPIELTTEEIRNSKAYKEYYACATGETAPKPKASARKKKGKQPTRATTPTEPTDVKRTKAEQLKIVLRRIRQETHISQQRGSGTDEGTSSRPGVPDVPSDDLEEELLWNSFDDEDDEAEKVNDDDDDEEEISKIGEQEATESDEGHDEATESDRENNEDDDNNEEDQGLRIGEEERMQEEEEADELYRDSDAQQESSSTSSFMTNLLNPIIDPATGSAGRSTTGSQSRQLSASESAFADEPMQTTCQMEEPSHSVFETDFSNFIMNRLGVDTLTPELLAGLTYELMRGSCNSLTELEYHLEEVYKATTDQLDWVNPEGQQYPHNLLQPLPLIPDNRGRSVIPFEHFINNDLEYLRGGASIRKYTTSVTKTKAAECQQVVN